MINVNCPNLKFYVEDNLNPWGISPTSIRHKRSLVNRNINFKVDLNAKNVKNHTNLIHPYFLSNQNIQKIILDSQKSPAIDSFNRQNSNLNLNLQSLQNTLTKYQERLDADGIYGWKHAALDDNFSLKENHFMIIMFRNFSSWIPKMREVTYEKYPRNRLPMSHFLKTDWRPENENHWKNIFEMRSTKYQSYLKFINSSYSVEEFPDEVTPDLSTYQNPKSSSGNFLRAIKHFFIEFFTSSSKNETQKSATRSKRSNLPVDTTSTSPTNKNLQKLLRPNVIGITYENLKSHPEQIFKILKHVYGLDCINGVNQTDHFIPVDNYVKFHQELKDSRHKLLKFKEKQEYKFNQLEWNLVLEGIEKYSFQIEKNLGYL